MAVSLAMIVRNEARCLPRCLGTVREAVDEIVVVDTGSTDGTVEIARTLADRVLHFVWCDDFARARQHAFDAARGEWVMWLDADDVVHGAARIRAAAAAAPPGIGGLCWRYLYARDAWANPRCTIWRERCVRHDGSFRWRGAIHEVLAATRAVELMADPGVLVEHRPEPAAQPAKRRRNRDLLEAALARGAREERPRLLFYLADELAAAEEPEAACAALREVAEAGGWEEERYLALVRLAALERGRRDLPAAKAADAAAQALRPDWPEAAFGLAATAYAAEDWDAVLRHCDAGRALGLPERLHSTDPTACRSDWIILYTNALYRLGRVPEALAWTRRALALVPDDAAHQRNFLFFATLLAEAPALEVQP